VLIDGYKCLAIELEEEADKKIGRLMKDIAHEYISLTADGKAVDMREYHVDAHSSFSENYVNEENKKFGGNLSVRKQPEERVAMRIGKDESIFHHSFILRWAGSVLTESKERDT
jgi:hypothetical protein